MSSIATPQDWSFYSIVAAFTLSAIPAAYSYGLLTISSRGRMQNTRPRANLDALKGKIPDDVWKKCYRARCAHFNALENLPIFAAAVLGSRLGGLPIATVNGVALQYLGLRAIYTVLYINTTKDPYSFLRSAVWFYCTFLPLQLLYKTGQFVNGKSV
ncbi:MAG: hypothetical protein M1823_004021 [Watsoniomyces obsoletus]|nr:MAG: hypothetical protein M1823_004021 [Watsoniomyces obsoletus]